MDILTLPAFDAADVQPALAGLDDDAIDRLDFGVIGFDANHVVRRYNRFESEAAGLTRERVIGRPFFDVIAPCMNNFLVAQRFVDAHAAAEPLDAVIDYTLTLRMKPTRVGLRLVACPGVPISYVLVRRRPK